MEVVELGSDEKLVTEACQCLMEQWPGVSLDRRKALVSAAGGRSFGLVTDAGECIGHVRMQSVADTHGEGPACAVTSVVIAKRHRGNRYGSVLMAVLDGHARSLGYTYVYLWTSTAAPFYRKCGYLPCDRVNLDKPALRHLNEEAVSALEAMLQSRVAKIEKAQQNGFYEDNPQQGVDVVWMRKRLVESLPSVARTDEAIETMVHSVVSQNRFPSFTYFIHNVPSQRQIGPSCGLTALRMAHDFYLNKDGSNTTPSASLLDADSHSKTRTTSNNSSSTTSAGLLDEAIKHGFSQDGEMFSVPNLSTLATRFLNLRAELHTIADEEAACRHIVGALRSGRLVVFPYDREPGTSMPALYGGLYSHYCVFTGYGVREETGGTGCRRRAAPFDPTIARQRAPEGGGARGNSERQAGPQAAQSRTTAEGGDAAPAQPAPAPAHNTGAANRAEPLETQALSASTTKAAEAGGTGARADQQEPPDGQATPVCRCRTDNSQREAE
eukprot:gene14722-22519_t